MLHNRIRIRDRWNELLCLYYMRVRLNSVNQFKLGPTRLLFFDVTVSHDLYSIDFVFFDVSAFLDNCCCTFADDLQFLVFTVKCILRDPIARVRQLLAVKDISWQTAVAGMVTATCLLQDLSAEIINFLIIVHGTLPIVLEAVFDVLIRWIALILLG